MRVLANLDVNRQVLLSVTLSLQAGAIRGRLLARLGSFSKLVIQFLIDATRRLVGSHFILPWLRGEVFQASRLRSDLGRGFADIFL